VAAIVIASTATWAVLLAVVHHFATH
jgi:hypothetical protein